MRLYQRKFDNERDAVALAKQRTKASKQQHYVIREERGFIVNWFVEDESPMLRNFEAQVYPK